MRSPEALLGGRTRFCIIEALAQTKQPITAYQIAMAKGLDPSATYRCLVEFSNFGVVESETKGRNQTFYRLSKVAGTAAADLLRALVKKKSESNDLEEWLAPKMQAERMAKIARLDKSKLQSSRYVRATGQKSVSQLMSKRIPGELSALIESSKIEFNGLFLQQGSRVYLLRNNK